MAYDHITFIGYVIDTAPREEEDGTSTYVGLDDPALDIAARCQLMLEAMEAARALLPAPLSPPGSVLHVFMAPEFFFRGAKGAYELDDVQRAIAMLGDMTKDEKWDDWLFAFGTIVGQYKLGTGKESPPLPVQICNFSLVRLGGVAGAAPGGARAIVKEFMSNIDFITGQAMNGGLLLGAVAHPDAAAAGAGRERQQNAYDGAGIFSLAGVEWAVDICLDHAMRRLQQSPQLPNETQVQVQLLPSCGMSIDEATAIAQPGGYIFNVDGAANGAHSTLRRLRTLAAPAGNLWPTVTDLDIDHVTPPDKSPPQAVRVDDLFAGGAGAIHVYEPVEVPAAQTVPGTVEPFVWQFSAPDQPLWQFTFNLIYDADDMFIKALVQIESDSVNFRDRVYFTPVVMRNIVIPPVWPNVSSQVGKIEIDLDPTGGDGYDYALTGQISLPGARNVDRNFDGTLLLFMKKRDANPVKQAFLDESDDQATIAKDERAPPPRPDPAAAPRSGPGSERPRGPSVRGRRR